MSSDYSQCSSGYSSDNSYSASVGILPYPKGICKLLPNIAEKEQGSHENSTNLPIQTTLKTSSDKLIDPPMAQKQCKKHMSSTNRTRIPKPSSGSTRMPRFVPDSQHTSPTTLSPSTIEEDDLASENMLVLIKL